MESIAWNVGLKAMHIKHILCYSKGYYLFFLTHISHR